VDNFQGLKQPQFIHRVWVTEQSGYPQAKPMQVTEYKVFILVIDS
jgi:hypothetical protein